MKQYAGLDVSLKEISICVVDADGAVLLRGTVPSDPEAVASFLAKHRISSERIVSWPWSAFDLATARAGETGAAGHLH